MMSWASEVCPLWGQQTELEWGLCLHPLVSVPDAVGRGTIVAPWLQQRQHHRDARYCSEFCSLMMTLAVHPPKAASTSCLKGLPPGLEEGLGVIGICCSGLICS